MALNLADDTLCGTLRALCKVTYTENTYTCDRNIIKNYIENFRRRLVKFYRNKMSFLICKTLISLV